MGKQTSHEHPNRALYQLQQIALALLIVAALLAAMMSIIAAVLLSLPLFVIMSVVIMLVCAPLLMAMVNTPPVTVNDEGLRLQHFIGGERQIAWEDIERIAVYPLLPQPEQEVLKQYLIGRKKYRAADGIMLIVPSLPFPYRIAGVLSGEKGAPIVAFTNRSHRDYETLKHRIIRNANQAVQDNLLIEE